MAATGGMSANGMMGLGRREVVGLALFAVALLAAASFYLPDSHAGENPRAISAGATAPLGEPVTPVAVRTPAEPRTPASPIARGPLPAPASWTLTYIPDGAKESDYRVVTATGVDLAYAGAPFEGFTDDAWGVRAEAVVDDLARGRYTFIVQSSSEATVLVDGRAVKGMRVGGGRRAVFSFVHEAGPLRVRVEARDGGGAFSLALSY